MAECCEISSPMLAANMERASCDHSVPGAANLSRVYHTVLLYY